MNAYQYVIIRYVHNLSTEEFVNIGILLWSPEQRRVFHQIDERYSRLSNFFDGFSSNGYRRMLKQLKGSIKSAQINERLLRESRTVDDIAGQVFSLGPSCFQWSESIGGITEDPSIRVRAIFSNIIDRHYEKHEVRRRTENEIYQRAHKRLLTYLRRAEARKLEQDVEVKGQHFNHTFRLGWQNGTQQFLEPISFDYSQGADLVQKALAWSGRLHDLSKNHQNFKMTGVVAPPRDRALFGHYKEAIEVLQESPNVRAIVQEDEFDQFVPNIKQDLTGQP